MRLLELGKEILVTLEGHGHEAYFVGGCVRDHLLQRPLHDVDICTSALPTEVCAYFPKTIQTGIKHGTVTVLVQGEPYEVTTYRTESEYIDARRPSAVQFVRSLKLDVERRDFTINALAMDRNGRVYDYVGGQQDLTQKRIRAVGDPVERFREDALRMLRAIRFIAQLGFTADDSVVQAIQQEGLLLEKIAMERVTSEFEKIMEAPYVDQGLSMLAVCNIFQQLPPFTTVYNIFRHLKTFSILRNCSVLERWLLLLSFTPYEEGVSFLAALRLPKHFVLPLKRLLPWVLDTKPICRAEQLPVMDLFSLGKVQAAAIIKVNQLKHQAQADEIELEKLFARYEELPVKERTELALDGNDLIAIINRTPGSWIESLLQLALEAVLTKRVENSKEKLIAFVLESEKNERHS